MKTCNKWMIHKKTDAKNICSYQVVKLLLEKGADKTIKASHRKFNRSDLTAADVAKDDETKALFA